MRLESGEKHMLTGIEPSGIDAPAGSSAMPVGRRCGSRGSEAARAGDEQRKGGGGRAQTADMAISSTSLSGEGTEEALAGPMNVHAGRRAACRGSIRGIADRGAAGGKVARHEARR